MATSSSESGKTTGRRSPARKGYYFQFPLCALAFPASDRDRLNRIISFAVVEAGRRQWRKFTEAERSARRFSPLQGSSAQQSTVDRSNDPHLEVIAGAEYLNVTPGNTHHLLDQHAELTRFVHGFEQEHGKDASVRVAIEWVFEARDNKGISCRELYVLAAIYSKIGCKRGAVRITRDEIWRRAHGYKSAKVLAAAFAPRRRRRYGQPPQIRYFRPEITQRQVRSIIERLGDRKFFARATYAKRQTYYSHRLSADQLSESIFNQKIRRRLAAQARAKADEELTNRVKIELHKLATS